MKQDIKKLWKDRANAKLNTVTDHIHYCVLRAMISKSNDKEAIVKHLIRKSFTPVTNTIKVANGRFPFDTIFHNMYRLSKNSHLLGIEVDKILDEDEITLFNQIFLSLTPSKLTRCYSYFFTRQDIFKEYQLVQTAHAALKLGTKLQNVDIDVDDLHFTCCGVLNLEALEEVEKLLDSLSIKYETFREPDIGNQKTAIAVYPVIEHKRGVLLNYKLLRFNKDPVIWE